MVKEILESVLGVFTDGIGIFPPKNFFGYAKRGFFGKVLIGIIWGAFWFGLFILALYLFAKIKTVYF
jgi:hypothetical protein